MRRSSVPFLTLFVVLSVAVLALPSGSRKAQAKDVGPPEVAWKDMKFKQKRAYMKSAVMPTMKPVFQAFDGEKFEKFTCETCHGKDAADRKYKMPSNDIHPLPSTPEAFGAKLKTEKTWPKWTKFMGGEVEPKVAGLLGMPVYDPKKPVEGAFGCVGCHKLEGAKP